MINACTHGFGCAVSEPFVQTRTNHGHSKRKILYQYQKIITMEINLPTEVNITKGKGLVFDGKSQHVQFPSDGFPMGNSARTLAFWVRAVPNMDGKPRYIVNWGDPGSSLSAFGVYARYLNNKYSFCFWSHNGDFEPVATIPDDQWHFVALTYDGTYLYFFLDGELTQMRAIPLDTKPGPAFIGSCKGSTHFFEGVVRDVAVWNHARNQKQIQLDMVPWPRLAGNEDGLVACLPLNEGTGNAFSDIKNAIQGTIDGKATWSKPIAINPDPINEGIWFVIQNKADLDNDTEIPARRKALSASDGPTLWATIPLAGDCDAFLWRAVLQNGKCRLINKKTGMAKALTSYSGKRFTYMTDYGKHKEEQEWIIQQTNPDDWGTNVYTLSNIYVSINEAFSLEGNEARFVVKKEKQPNQAWVLQPMELAIGYHIPTSSPANSPMCQELEMAYGFKVYASNTVREWSVLNGHLIWKNMLNALYNADAINNFSKYTRKELQIISRFDQNSIVAQYPLNMANGQIIWNENWFTRFRGGSAYDPNRSLSSTTASEEMMCRRGTFSTGYHQRDYREFDQAVHEFAHALDYTCGMDGENFPLPHPFGSKKEVIAAAIQAWFNNNAYAGFARTREQQKTGQPEHYKRLAEFFRESNSWMPPRWLRDQPHGRVELKVGETLQVGEWIYSTPPYGPSGSYAVLMDDGNFVVCSNDGNILKWGSHNTLGVPLNQIKTLNMENGILHMKDASGNSVYFSDNPASPGARLVVAEPLPDKPNSWIRIVDSEGSLIWNP